MAVLRCYDGTTWANGPGIRRQARLPTQTMVPQSLRAVTNLPAHLTKVSNEELCVRFGVKEPISALHDLTCNKLRKLHNLPTDHISADPCVIDHWAECERALGVLRHTTHLVTAQIPPGCAGVPCPECGQYFSSVKAVRQHAARRHGIKTVALTEIEYRQEEHSQEGMPQCVHCGKRCGSSDGLRHHILTNACNWYRPAAASVCANTLPVDEAVTESHCCLGTGSPRTFTGTGTPRGWPAPTLGLGDDTASGAFNGTRLWRAGTWSLVGPTTGKPSTAGRNRTDADGACTPCRYHR